MEYGTQNVSIMKSDFFLHVVKLNAWVYKPADPVYSEGFKSILSLATNESFGNVFFILRT